MRQRWPFFYVSDMGVNLRLCNFGKYIGRSGSVIIRCRTCERFSDVKCTQGCFRKNTVHVSLLFCRI